MGEGCATDESRRSAGDPLPIAAAATPSPFPPVVSSAHLAAGGSPALSELEYGLILASHAFTRWMSRCMTAAGLPGLPAARDLPYHAAH